MVSLKSRQQCILGAYIEEKAVEFDFTPATLNQVSKMIEHMGGIEQVDPHHNDSDSSIGAFIMYVLKDACEFAGFLPKRKSVPSK